MPGLTIRVSYSSRRCHTPDPQSGWAVRYTTQGGPAGTRSNQARLRTNPLLHRAVTDQEKGAVGEWSGQVDHDAASQVVATRRLPRVQVAVVLPGAQAQHAMAALGISLDAVARAIAFAIEQPDDVEIGDMTIRPASQG
jgi:hypothetical protein